MLIVFPSLMIVHNFDIFRAVWSPVEADSVLSVDTDTELTLAVAA